jgi:hypothetical protein
LYISGWVSAGCVLLVVAELAESSDVDHHVLAELMRYSSASCVASTTASGSSPLTCSTGASTILTMSVQYTRRAHVARVGGGEADLVVDDDVHRAAGGIATGLRQGQGFLVDALAAEGGIAVDQHRQHLLALGVATAVHAGAHRALDHRVDDLQVRRVEGQRSGAPARRGWSHPS